MRLLDLFCGAGGAAAGYHRVGFDEILGVDIAEQPNYPYSFVQADALEWMEEWVLTGHERFDAIHASPPCQAHVKGLAAVNRKIGREYAHTDYISETRQMLEDWAERFGGPYVIENVPGSPLDNPVRLCGSSLGLGAVCRDGKRRQLRRHRLFETNFPIMSVPCSHEGEPVGVYGNGGGQQKTVWNGGRNRGYMATKAEAEEALGIDWMTKVELSNAIPPAYTELVGPFLMAALKSASLKGW